ncbi:19140_t:CDS:2 [Cetraspora pellucida]|uniref:19140_t:CDS:1 n=1 Tax=Cetraspora pellucida TaxID=1433469 RepID=A0A9N9HLN8_9GLOM|nr:19140_t:CDS:2 [Cetraspora pellucida]
MNLALSCKRWSLVWKDSQVKAEWIIFKYGRAHCLFHSIRLGPKFISVEVAHAIITKGGILSRYFAQRLLIHYGEYDQKLIELKASHNIGQSDLEKIQTNTPWANNLPITVSFLILFPPAQPHGWTKPEVKAVKERLLELIDLGFKLNYDIIIEIFHLFERRLDEIGKILIDSFKEIKQETQENFLHRCLSETQNPNITNFLHKYLQNNSELNVKKHQIIIKSLRYL